MKQSLLLCILYFGCILTVFSQSQTRTANNVTINWNSAAWLDRSAGSFASDDNKYAYTKTTSGQLPVFFDHFGFDIPVNAAITKLVCTVRRFKTGKGEVKDMSGVTWFLARCYCSFGDCNCNYGPAMNKTEPWNTKETVINYEQAGTGIYTRTVINEDGSKTMETVPYEWTPGKINDPMFGFTFNPTINIKGGGAAIYIDRLVVTVYYTVPQVKTDLLNSIDIKYYNNLVTVAAKQFGKYKLTVTDRSGRTLQQTILKSGLNEQVLLNSICRGYCIITVEGSGQKRSIQTFIQ